MNNITCPSCGKNIEIDKALTHQFEEKFEQEKAKSHKLEIEKAKQEATALAQEKAKETAQKDLEQANKEKMELQKQLANQERLRIEQEKKIREDVFKKAEDEQRLKLKEKDLQLEEIRRVNEDLKRKLEQGSQQRQGEALELDLEERLRQTFPQDEFLPVPKGVEGADIWQKVRFNGKEVGSILWETKRTKAWSNSWLTKLKDNAAKISASESIIVSQVLPDKCLGFDRREGVWITGYEYAINICRYIRFLLTTIHSVKQKVSHSDEDWGKIRDYMMSDSFKHRMLSHFDSVKILRDELEKEERSSQIRWKRQKVLIDKLDLNLVNFYGELKALVPNLPEINDIEQLPQTDEENNISLI
ncbi:MAG: DUF2130 domain-containing protein [Patescibacteria group bacterium]|nr:DUF2130 domain-containing protein [Patescibacteria group bacterium]